MMITYVFDDGGREAAGYKGTAGDCVVRALCILTGADYETVYKEFAQAQYMLGDGKLKKRSARNGIQNRPRDFVFREHGLVKVKLGRGVKPTWSEAYERYGDCIVKTRKHLSALIGGVSRDTHDWRGYWWSEGVVLGYDAAEKPEDCIPEWRERKATSVWVAANDS